MKKQLAAIALLLTTTLTFAQETTPAPSTTFAGSADAYYKYDFSGIDNSLTSFTNSHNSFELGMASIEASHKMGKASVFVDLGFGSRAAQFTYNDDSTTFMIKQLNFTYEFSDKFKVTAGSFGTHIGYELLDAVDNKNYSMSYAFTYGPFFNTGVKAQYTSGKFSFMAGVSNPTDFKSTIDAGSTQKTFIGQLAFLGDTGSAYFNVTSGSSNPSSDENKTQFDFVGTKKLSDTFSLGFNGTYAMTTNDFDSDMDGEWFALVGYANIALKESLSLAYRLEYLDAKEATPGLGLLAGTSVIGNTLSLNYKVGNLTIIPEFRLDTASEDIFADSDAAPKGLTAYALLATTYSF
ncbi:outer membrane beta-barrel protein [Flavobacterium sinopsychrotolerans]|uniref:Putative beta-barrel porin-2, OmpL-like. bbp2 n=1 Tax=Flavobacterium sinopsychrotolerans TaxID=604089 RepID=A0A1H8KPD0_9FLAO|nr:outer membrane beta-barrel protein [Flavobacterium sinopsychrotolerans]SEN94717.1 Putative beta-barrel porin-2, OmpL-like. bbp2 [Flavobacterium sinopsychrotolerans]